jgi:lipopolysaccharide biosynthesis glycosyltransferase
VSVGRWRRLDPVWNQFLSQGGGQYIFRYRPDGILHFTTSSKPWDPRSIRYPQTDDVRRAFRQYRGYLWQSGWFQAAAAVQQRATYSLWRTVRGARRLVHRSRLALGAGGP